jgi:hypothetical protein
VTAGRSGSTLLCKAFSKLPKFVSRSTEDGERSIFTSVLQSIFDGFALKYLSTIGTSSGTKDAFFNVPFLDNIDPLRSTYNLQFVATVYEIALAVAKRHYSPQAVSDSDKIVVEKNWCQPILPQLGPQFGIRQIVLLREPVALANSVRQYHLRTRYPVGFDPLDDDKLSQYVAKICATLAFLAKNIPGAIVVRYEDLTANLTSEMSVLCRRIGVELTEFEIHERLQDLSGPPQDSVHRTEVHEVPTIFQRRLQAECSEYLKQFYFCR